MALMHGKQGRIEWDASVVRTQLELAQAWTCDVSHGVSEITSMGDTWKTYLGGYRDWTATVECLLPAGGTNIPYVPDGDTNATPNSLADVPAYLELYFKYDATNDEYRMLFGQCICTGFTYNINNVEIPTITYLFQGADMLAWDSESEALHSYA